MRPYPRVRDAVRDLIIGALVGLVIVRVGAWLATVVR